MSYAIVLEPAAREEVDRLLAPVRAAVLRQIGVLAASPSRAKTRRARYPFATGQLYQIDVRAAGVTCNVDVVHLYGQDEQTLHIQRVYVEYE